MSLFNLLFLVGLISAGTIDASGSPSQVQIGANYTFDDSRIGGHSFRGSLGGAQGLYEYKPANSLYGAFKVTWRQGQIERSHAHRDVTYVDAQERIGYTYFPCSERWSTTLFSGFGYRFLQHRLTQSNTSSIQFEYNEFYVPVGFLTEYALCSQWSLGLNFTWMPQVYPTVEITPLKGARWVLKNTMGNFLVELPLTYFPTGNPCYTLIFKPFYEHWEDGRSTARTANGQSLGLPKMINNYWGAEFNIGLSF
jgi:hypothetical protein